jgi:hypothetical protein
MTRNDEANIQHEKSLLWDLTQPEQFWKVKGYGRFVLAIGLLIQMVGSMIYIAGAMLKRIHFARERDRRDGKWQTQMKEK